MAKLIGKEFFVKYILRLFQFLQDSIANIHNGVIGLKSEKLPLRQQIFRRVKGHGKAAEGLLHPIGAMVYFRGNDDPLSGLQG